MMYKFSGINIYSKTPEKVFDFYKRLGFHVLEESSPDDRWYGAMLALQENETEPVIWIWRSNGDDNTAARNHLVFNAKPDLDELHKSIVSAGIECPPPFTAVWGGRELILHDPEGNELLFL